jgi:hypothetical protein
MTGLEALVIIVLVHLGICAARRGSSTHTAAPAEASNSRIPPRRGDGHGHAVGFCKAKTGASEPTWEEFWRDCK